MGGVGGVFVDVIEVVEEEKRYGNGPDHQDGHPEPVHHGAWRPCGVRALGDDGVAGW